MSTYPRNEAPRGAGGGAGAGREPSRRGAARLAGRTVVTLRWIVVAAWIAAAVVTTVVFPAPAPAASGLGGVGLQGLLPTNSKAYPELQRAAREFRVPVLAETAVVVHEPGGLGVLTRADAVLWALAHAQAYVQGRVPQGPGHILAAVPVPTATPDTVVTYLYLSPGTSSHQVPVLARRYADHFDQPGVQTYVTGIVPAQVRQTQYLQSRLHLFEILTVVLIATVVGLAFGSVVAPAVVLAAAGAGYAVALWVLGRLAAVLGFALPQQIEPLIAALLIGVVTDYCVLFFSGFRSWLEQGYDRREAAARAVAVEGPIIVVAGLTVAGGTASLLAARYQLFRALGPALALTVVVGVVVSVTLVPALIAILGRRLFFPAGSAGPRVRGALPGRIGPLVRTVSHRGGAAVVIVLVCGLLLAAATPLTGLRLSVSFTADLPRHDEVRQGARVLADAGIPGVVAPTEVLVEGPGVTAQRDALARFQELVAARPGVAQVLGPAQDPLPDDYGVVLASSGNAARLIVVLDSDPLSAPAIADLRGLQAVAQNLLDQAGVRGASVVVTGQTAIAAELVQLTRSDLRVTLLVALGIELVILVIFLRSLVAPVLLLACSALGIAAALGLTVLVFQQVRGDPGLTFYAPFAAAVLLLALGSDYNVFAVGSIWHEATRSPLRTAIRRALPSTARAITAAGVILASTFAMLAVIPLETFRQVAFTMGVGLLIDTFLVRPLLTPAVLTVLGRAAGWPSRRIRTAPAGVPARAPDSEARV